MIGLESCVALSVVPTHAQHLSSEPLKLAVVIPKSAGLLRADRRFILGVEEKDNGPAGEQALKAMILALFVKELEGRGSVTCSESRHAQIYRTGPEPMLQGRVFYRLLVRPFLYFLSAERAHRLVVGLLRLSQALPGGLVLLRLLFGRTGHPGLEVMGLHFPTPVGLAAGFDKDAEVYPALGALGFGFVEVGTLTAQGQPGNPQPRLFRLVKDRALVNRMGFNNHGAAHAAERLARTPRPNGPILGINIGKTKIVPPEEAVSDYVASARLLAPYADYFVVNVSSPNTPGLRDLQAVESLRPILVSVREALDEVVTEKRLPLLVKIAPDLNDDDIRGVAHLALEIGLEGIIATNTTISRAGLQTPASEVEALGAGGLSGKPLKARALEVLRLLRKEAGDDLVLIAAGGIETAADAADRLKAGANLVQIYSALVFDGPSLPGRIARGLK